MPRSAVFPAADDMTTLRVCSVWRESPEWESRSEQTAYMMSFLRAQGAAAEVYPDAAKMKKQISFANAVKVPYFAIIGESELAEGTVTIKNMAEGTQETVPFDGIASALK